MKLTRRGRGVIVAAVGLLLLAVLTWAAVKDAGLMDGYQESCPTDGVTFAPVCR